MDENQCGNITGKLVTLLKNALVVSLVLYVKGEINGAYPPPSLLGFLNFLISNQNYCPSIIICRLVPSRPPYTATKVIFR
jgi:hypothetical protein